MSILSILILFTVIIRAFKTGITYDEGYTCLEYSRIGDLSSGNPYVGNVGGTSKFFAFLIPILANNHPLNSLLVSIFSLPDPFNECLIRMPNIVFCVVYMVISILLLSRISLKWMAFSLLLLNYYVIEFFGLARGYGIACSLMLIALYCYYRLSYSRSNLLFILYTLLLACYGQLICIPVFIMLCIDLVISHSKNEIIEFLHSSFYHLTAIAVAFVYACIFLHTVGEQGLPLYGTSENFYSAVISSYLSMILPPFAKSYYLYITILTISMLCLPLFIKTTVGNLRIWRLMIGSFALIAFSSMILNKPLPTERVLIPLWPLVVMSIIEICEGYYLRLNEKGKVAAHALSIVIMVAISMNFISKLNLSSTEFCRDQYPLKAEVYNDYKENNCISLKYIRNYTVLFYMEKIKKENKVQLEFCNDFR